jgi:hypothetical protein
LTEPVIERAEISPGHSGQAELLVRIRYENGSLGDVTLDARCADQLMRDCNAASIEELAGQPWHRILNVLT